MTTPGERLAQYLLGDLPDAEPMSEDEALKWERVLCGVQPHGDARYRHEDDMREAEDAEREASDKQQHEGTSDGGF